MSQYSIGIDISKAHLDVYEFPDGRSRRFENHQAGFDELKGWLPAKERIARLIYEGEGTAITVPIMQALNGSLRTPIRWLK